MKTKLLIFAMICFGWFLLYFQSFAEMWGHISRSMPTDQTFESSELFLQAKWNICEVATDGCNTVTMMDGWLGAMTMMWCEDIYGEDGQEAWSCRNYQDGITQEQVNEAQDYIRNNLDVLVSQDAVLGGTWYVASFEWIDTKSVLVTAEDWHIQDTFTFYLVDMHTSDNNDVMCTMEYDPVCAQPPMPECPDGFWCIQVMPPLQTYSNACFAQVDHAEIMYTWECQEDNKIPQNWDDMRVCTMEYAPVCGVDSVTYWNACMAWDTEILYKGECEDMVDYVRMKQLIERFEQRYIDIIKEISPEQRYNALEMIDQKINIVKLSRVASWLQEKRITDLIFFRHLFEKAPYN